MEIKGKDVSLYLSGQQIPIPNCNIAITQPTIKQIVVFGEDYFFQSVQILTQPELIANQVREDNPQLAMLSDFQLLLIILKQDRSLLNCIKDFLELSFSNYQIEIKDSAIEFSMEEQLVGVVNPFNFTFFQIVIDNLFNLHMGEDKEEYKPVDDKAAEIAAKLKRGREKVADLKNSNKDKKDSSLFGTLISTLSIGMQMDIRIFFEYTPFQLYDSFNRFNSKEENDFYKKIISTPLMDASAMDEPEPWKRDLYI